MLLKYFSVYVIFIVGLFQQSFAQVNPIDSLKRALKNCINATDSTSIYCQLCWRIGEANLNESILYGGLALKTSASVKDPEVIANAYDAAAYASLMKGDSELAKEQYLKSITIGIKNTLPYRIAWGSFHLAEIYLAEGNFNEVKILAYNGYKNFLKSNNQQMAINSYWQLVKINPNQFADSLVNMIIEYLPQVQAESDKMSYYLEISKLFNMVNNKKKAMYYVQLAMEIADKNENTKGIINAYYQIANYFSEIQHNYPMALKYLERIREQYEKIPSKNQGGIYLDIGEIYRLSGDIVKAQTYFNKGLESALKVKHRHPIASAYLKLGDINYQQKKYVDALYYYIKCYDTNCDVCPRIKFHDALVNIGNVYLYSKDPGNARKYYQKSLEIADSASDKRAQSYSYQAFANFYETQGNIQKAVEFSKKALLAAKSADYLEGQQYNINKLSELYTKRYDYKTALQYKNQSDQLKDSISKINEIDNLAKLETYFDFKNLQVQRELDKTQSVAEISHQKLIRNFFVIGFIIISAFGVLIFIGYRRKKTANKLLGEQKIAIENMSAKVHEADLAKLEFYTNVSHELKTPLTLIIGMTDRIKSVITDHGSVHVIRKNAIKLLQLVNHLLDLRKIDTSRMELSVKEGNLGEFLKGILSSFENLFKQKQINVEFQYTDQLIVGYFDYDKLEKVFSNLISNAIKYTNNNGFVKIQLEKRNDGYTEITFTDNGIGIAENDLRHIFERFYRVPGTSNHGSGIGLALVKELVEIHKGEIKVDSIKSKGSTFKVILPIERWFYTSNEITGAEEHSNWNFTDIFDEDKESPDINDNPDTNSTDKSLLIVEDNADLRKFIAEIFKPEFHVIEAGDGIEGYKISREMVPDIIISDIMMPNLSGIQLVERIKNDMATSHIPVILLTAKNDIATHLNSFEKGADDFIAKPFDSAILKSRVENLLRLRKQLVEKFSKQFQLQPREIVIENADQKFIQKAIEIIEKNMSNPNLDVDLLALELGVSRTQLYRKLNALTDYPPKHFIRIIRLKRAAQILKQGQNNIAEVMDATGFSNYSYFNNCFRDFFGKYPKDYTVVNVGGSLN